MTNQPIRVEFVDDREQEAQRYRERLTRSGRLDVHLTLPTREIELAPYLAAPPDLFLLDYELDQKQSNGTYATYLGGTLSAAIREKVRDRPIVLITWRNKPIWKQHRRLVAGTRIFDSEVYKDDIDDNLDLVVQELCVLADGFRRLREDNRTDPNALFGALEAAPEEQRLLRETGLPSPGWEVPEAAHWIRDVVLRYPGIVYDPIHAATALGLAIGAFTDERVRGIMAPAKYVGVFDPPQGRWWKPRLYAISAQFAREQEVTGPINRAFAAAFKKAHGDSLAPAKCIVCGKLADWVCYITHQPVQIEHSLAYYPDNRPAVMDQARVSFTAIRESNEVLDELFDAESADLLDGIRRGGSEV